MRSKSYLQKEDSFLDTSKESHSQNDLASQSKQDQTNRLQEENESLENKVVFLNNIIKGLNDRLSDQDDLIVKLRADAEKRLIQQQQAFEKERSEIELGIRQTILEEEMQYYKAFQNDTRALLLELHQWKVKYSELLAETKFLQKQNKAYQEYEISENNNAELLRDAQNQNQILENKILALNDEIEHLRQERDIYGAFINAKDALDFQKVQEKIEKAAADKAYQQIKMAFENLWSEDIKNEIKNDYEKFFKERMEQYSTASEA